MRKDGKYWIKIYQNSDWQIADYCSKEMCGETIKVFKTSNGYIIPNCCCYEEKDIFEICENEITVGFGD